ncbi:ERI1 exoribonuclease 2 [Collichthys lucidus]|uniref:ERI1 exoribonuclease 2 n=1 Tax=Collichthys lucidus TaxID=240159 RepID=A0A4U5U332_COLLU|nr:ERI1 exoribonuclease 2 [Collichthys lucidus]
MSTKKLARELGLLRQRSQSSNGLKKPLLTNQIFAYLIVIDFESTCWREKNNYTQEIIEFPAVLLNTSTGEVESEFHTYVQPQEHPVLSEFCTELTGITQMQVEAGIPLQICLSRFSRWLQNLQLNMGVVFPNRQQTSNASSASQKLCTFLTWSGLDDSRNTAQLAARMMRDGCVMKITRSLVTSPSMVKPMFGNTATDNQKEKSNIAKEENTRTTNKLSKIPPKSCQIKSCTEVMMKDLGPKENSSSAQESVQSLILPVTLLNGTTMPLWGNHKTSVHTEAATNISSLVMRNCASPHINNNSNSLVLCSTTVGCLSNQSQTNQPAKSDVAVGLVEEEHGAELLVETEDRCSSYDNMVLESGDEGEVYVSEDDSRCYVQEEPDDTHSPGCQVMFGNNIRVANNFETEKMISESAMSFSAKKMASLLVPSMSNSSVIISKPSTTSEHSTHFADPNQTMSFSARKLASLVNMSNTSTVISKPSTTSEHSTHFADPNQTMSFSARKLASLVNMSNTSTVISKPSTTSEHSTHFADPNQTMSFSAKKLESLVNMTNSSIVIRKRSAMSEPSTHFAVPKSVTGSNSSIVIRKPSTVSEPSTHFAVPKTVTGSKSKQHEPYKNSKTDTPFLLRHKLSMPGKTSTPISSFFRSKPFVTQQANKDTPKSSFTIFTDSAKPSDPSSHGSFCTSKNVLSSLSTNTFSSCNNRSSISVTMKGQRITSPLCVCGRRAKRQVVSNGGPNHGRGFYCCPVRRSGSGGKIQKGCEFFKWESALIKSSVASPAAVGSSVSLCNINSTVSCRPPQKSMIR